MADYNVTVSLGGVGATAGVGEFNILDYGAAGDGTTDDSSAIQAAVTAAIAAGYAQVIVPSGTYLVQNTIEIDSRVQIIGRGEYASQILVDVESGYGFAIRDTSDNKVFGVSVENIRLNANDATSTGILINDGSEVDLINVNFNGNFAVGLEIAGGTIINMYDCEWNVNDIHLLMKNGTSFGLTHITMSNCIMYSATDVAIYVDGAGTLLSQFFMNECFLEYNPVQLKINNANGNSGMMRCKFTNCLFTNGDDSFADTSCTWLIDAEDDSYYMVIDTVTFDNCVLYDPYGAYNVRINNYGSPNGSSTFQRVTFRDTAFYGASTAAVLTDVGYASILFEGSTRALDDWGAGSTIDFMAGGGQEKLATSEYESVKFTSIGLDPGGVPDSPYEGQLFYSSSLDKLVMYNGSAYERITSASAPSTAAADDTTPTVRGIGVLLLGDNTGATAITQLDNAVSGQQVVLVVTGSTNTPTIADSGNFNLSAAWAPGTGDTLTLVTSNGTTWYEIARSDN